MDRIRRIARSAKSPFSSDRMNSCPMHESTRPGCVNEPSVQGSASAAEIADAKTSLQGGGGGLKGESPWCPGGGGIAGDSGLGALGRCAVGARGRFRVRQMRRATEV